MVEKGKNLGKIVQIFGLIWRYFAVVGENLWSDSSNRRSHLKNVTDRKKSGIDLDRANSLVGMEMGFVWSAIMFCDRSVTYFVGNLPPLFIQASIESKEINRFVLLYHLLDVSWHMPLFDFLNGRTRSLERAVVKIVFFC